ncbi:hypothetical protein CXB51_026374 [Gossypium anomalum]|uniref:Protein LIKE COV 2-like n=2 Tax=Gossypium TaxID=3633 RepID=A0A8J5YKR1_9ROSI|nr:hypothetical protein CXB51_026374 [Gossypium anomalum]
MAMAEEKESTSIPLSQAENGSTDPEDPAKSPPSSPNSSTRKVFFSLLNLGSITEFSDLRLPLEIITPNAIVTESSQGFKSIFKCEINVSMILQACCFVLQSWFSKKFMTGCVVLFPVAVTFFITWWFIQFVDGFFSPLYERLGVDIFGLGFITSLLFVFFVGVFVSSWMGAAVFSVGEWVIKQMPFVRHIYSASKQISAAISPDQNTTAFKEVAIIRHPRVGEYAFGFITSTVILQNHEHPHIFERPALSMGEEQGITTTTGRENTNLNFSLVEFMLSVCGVECLWMDGWRENEDEELCSVFVPTNHLYIGDIFLVNSKEIIRPNLSIREGIEIIVSGGMTMPQVISPQERVARPNERIPMNRMV